MSITALAALTLGLHLASQHAPASDFQNQNWGAYARTEAGTELGAFRNSLGRPSIYLSQQIEVAQGWAGKLSLQAGVASGYQHRCKTETTVTLGTFTATFKDGTVITTYGPVVASNEVCSGFTNAMLAPLAGINYTLPKGVFGLTPRLQLLPGFSNHPTVIHLSVEF